MTRNGHRTIRATLEDESGLRVGRVKDVYVDAEDDRVRWLLVKVGRFTGRYALVPLEGIEVVRAGRVHAPYAKADIEWSPSARPGAPVDQAHELELCRHYRLAERESEIALQPSDATTAMPENAASPHAAERPRAAPAPALRSRLAA